MNAAINYVRECVRLLYWVFFKPTALRAHINQLAPDYEKELLKEGRTRTDAARMTLRILRKNLAMRAFMWQALVLIVVAPTVLYLISGLLVTVFGGHFYWLRSMRFLSLGIGLGLVLSVAWNFTHSVGYGVLFGLLFSVPFSITLGISAGMVFGVTFSTALMAALSVLMFGVFLRLPVFMIEVGIAVMSYRRDILKNQFENSLARSPIYFDELIVFPQPYLASLLYQTLCRDLDSGLQHASFIAAHPYQSWAVNRALKQLLANEYVPFFALLHRLLTSPVPHKPVEFEHSDLSRAAFPYYTTLRVLREVADVTWASFPQELGRRLTIWLRLRKGPPSKYANFAVIYYELLGAYWDVGDDYYDGEDIQARDIAKAYLLREAVAAFEEARGFQHGEEFYQSLRLIELGLQGYELSHIAKLLDDFVPLFAIAEPLRLPILTVFGLLRDAAIDATAFMTAEHALTRRDALLKAQGVLEEARRQVSEVYEPERSLLLAVIEHWRRMFAVAGGRVAEQREVEVLPNPYIAGPPIRPEDGQLFVGRRDEFRQIEEKLQSGVGLVIHGQRRIGKTSMLLHLPKRLPHDLLPVYLNLQRLMANTTSGFLHAVAREIVKQLPATLSLEVPSEAAFQREPFLSFNQLLDDIEARLPQPQRVLLSFDEFEELEARVKKGKIDADIFTNLRGITQTGRRFALLFAGLHTLEQMTQQYWHPFFQSVQPINIGYLSELDARQLITDPIEQFPLAYDEAAINRLTMLTNAHPYLTQSFCHNLINRLNDPLHRANRATVADVDAVLDKTLETSGYYFDDYVWGWSTADERLTLTLLAEAGEEAAFSVVEQHLPRETALATTKSLRQRDILSEHTVAGELRFRFRIPLSRLWVLRTQSSARLLLERTVTSS